MGEGKHVSIDTPIEEIAEENPEEIPEENPSVGSQNEEPSTDSKTPSAVNNY